MQVFENKPYINLNLSAIIFFLRTGRNGWHRSIRSGFVELCIIEMGERGGSPLQNQESKLFGFARLFYHDAAPKSTLEYKMASTRYGRIKHDRYSSINVKFPSPDARQAFADNFNAHHASHDHDGEIPTFEMIAAGDTKGYNGGRVPVDIESISIDGYDISDIEEYHEEDGLYTRNFYEPPTCCIAPIIVVNKEFIDSGTLERHELSSVFGDMPDDDYRSLLESIQKDGFMDPKIKFLDGKVLDGWHRYRAGKELNFLRKLKFQQWDEKDNGDPQAFVLARNIERRHLNASQRAQIVVTFNERFTRGDIETQRNGTPNGEPKTRQELAEEAGVGTSTIDRAVKVEQKGESEAVIAGEKTATEVISEATKVEALEKFRTQKRELYDRINQTALVKLNDEFGAVNKDKARHRVMLAAHNAYELSDALLSSDQAIDSLSADEIRKVTGKYFLMVRDFAAPRADWVAELYQLEKAEVEVQVEAESSEVIPEETLSSLWEQVSAEMPEWKKRDKERCKYESDHIGRVSKSMLILALRSCNDVDADGPATIEELNQLLVLMRGDIFSFIINVRNTLGKESQHIVEGPEGSGQGMLNKSNVDAQLLKDEVLTQGLAKLREKHKTVRQSACAAWLDWKALSDATTWEEVCDVACNQFAFLSKETFDGSREKPGFDDYEQLPA